VQSEYSHRLRDVLHRLLADILEARAHAALHCAIWLLEYVAEMDAYAKSQAAIGRRIAHRGSQLSLHVEARIHRAGGGLEHGEHRVAGSPFDWGVAELTDARHAP
jgi:hypothetical protein